MVWLLVPDQQWPSVFITIQQTAKELNRGPLAPLSPDDWTLVVEAVMQVSRSERLHRSAMAAEFETRTSLIIWV